MTDLAQHAKTKSHLLPGHLEKPVGGRWSVEHRGQSHARAVEAVGDDGAVVGALRVAIVRVQVLDVLRADGPRRHGPGTGTVRGRARARCPPHCRSRTRRRCRAPRAGQREDAADLRRAAGLLGPLPRQWRIGRIQVRHDPAADEPQVGAQRPTMMYCGMASSYHFTSASPRDSRCGYSTSRCAG
jgi:hypothetical protein